MSGDLYTRITQRILADLEQGVRPWIRPWNAGHAAARILRPLRWNGLPYRGINILLLWAEAQARGYASPAWLTYKQAQALGAQVRKGERGSLVVYADLIRRSEEDSTGDRQERVIPFFKSYTVFNAAQITGLPAQYLSHPEPRLDPVERIQHADAFFARTGVDIRQGSTMACYSLAEDRILMPPFATFRDAESYYATLAHEVTHWTRHRTRLSRDFGRHRYGDDGYAMEELVAELGSAFLCADLGLSLEPRPDHASYIASWLKVLRQDTRAIFVAASHGQRAADYLHGLQRSSAGVNAGPSSDAVAQTPQAV